MLISDTHPHHGIMESHDGAGVGGVLLADDPVAAAAGVAGVRLGHVLRVVLRRWRRRRRRRGRLRGLAAGAAVAPAVAVVAAAVGRPRRVRVRVRPRVRDLHHLGRRRGGLLLGWWGLLLGWLLLGFLLGWLLLGFLLGRLLNNRRRRRGRLLLLLRRRRGRLLLLGLLLLLRRRRRRRLDDLDLLDDLARLAAELVGELFRVERPRDFHLVVLLVEVDVIDAELTLLCTVHTTTTKKKPRRRHPYRPKKFTVSFSCDQLTSLTLQVEWKEEQTNREELQAQTETLDPVEHLLDLGTAAAAFQVHRDDDGRHLHRTAQLPRHNQILSSSLAIRTQTDASISCTHTERRGQPPV